MTHEAQRIAIAEVCPVVKHRNDALSTAYEPWPFDPLSDLNAMHEVEETLTPKQLSKYVGELARVLIDSEDGSTLGQQMWHATAAQRAGAFLRTLNLWDDSK